MRKLGFFCGFLLGFFAWLIIATTLACIPAAPFWMMEFKLTGCFVWLCVGMPFGMLFALFLLKNLFGKKDDRDGDDKTPDPEPEPPPDAKKNYPGPSVPINRIRNLISRN